MQLLLNKNELLNLGKDLRSIRIHCKSGCLWLTLTGDSRDHILHAGQTHAFTQRGKVLVTAMVDSQLELIAEAINEVGVIDPFFKESLCLNAPH